MKTSCGSFPAGRWAYVGRKLRSVEPIYSPLKRIVLPRQARGEHRESTQKRLRFSQVDAAFTTLRAQGGFLVSARYDAAARNVSSASVVSEAGRRLTLENPWAAADRQPRQRHQHQQQEQQQQQEQEAAEVEADMGHAAAGVKLCVRNVTAGAGAAAAAGKDFVPLASAPGGKGYLRFATVRGGRYELEPCPGGATTRSTSSTNAAGIAGIATAAAAAAPVAE